MSQLISGWTFILTIFCIFVLLQDRKAFAGRGARNKRLVPIMPWFMIHLVNFHLLLNNVNPVLFFIYFHVLSVPWFTVHLINFHLLLDNLIFLVNFRWFKFLSISCLNSVPLIWMLTWKIIRTMTAQSANRKPTPVRRSLMPRVPLHRFWMLKALQLQQPAIRTRCTKHWPRVTFRHRKPPC